MSSVPAAYACGITTYDIAHIGNLRAIFAAYWRSKSLGLRLIVNHTDVGPKVDSGCPASYREQLVGAIITEFENSCRLLGLEVTFAPVSRFLPSLIELILLLDQKGMVTQRSDGLYFEDGLGPFVLWRNLSRHRHAYGVIGPRGIFGAPGWNLECAGLIWHFTTKQNIDFRMHFGGHELRFPHHHSQARILKVLGIEIKEWSYVGALCCGSKKMSKSLKNVMYLPELMGRPCPYGRRFVRYCFFCSPPDHAMSLGPEDVASYKAAYLKLLQIRTTEHNASPYAFVQLHRILRNPSRADPRLYATLRYFDIVPAFHEAVLMAAERVRALWLDLKVKCDFKAADELRKLSHDNGILFTEVDLKLHRIDRLTAWCRCLTEVGADPKGLIDLDD